MCDSRTVPSGKVYRQLFDAQVQLSRSLLAGRRDTRTDSLSAEDSNTQSSTTSRWLLSSRGQWLDTDDVSRLPDTVVVDRPSSDIIERLSEKKRKKHEEALKQLEMHLTELTQVCESQVRTISLELLSSLQEADLRLNTLKDRMEDLEHVSVQEVCVLWEEVEQQVKLKKNRIMDLSLKLTETETHRAAEVRVLLRKFFHLLDKINFLPPPDVCRLIHTEATMLNQSLLANRRSAARVLLLLQEDNLQQESVLRLHWEDRLSHWRRSRVNEVVDRFRTLCSSEEDQMLKIQEMTGTQRALTEQRCDIINEICSLVPPHCSTALVSDWFSRLTAVSQQIDKHHNHSLHQQHRSYEHMWQHQLSEVERCQEALSALQLSDEEVQDVVSSQLLTLIGRSQSQDEERLAASDLSCDSVARHALSVSRRVFAVVRGAVSLWETHRHRLESREEELQKHLEDVRGSQQQDIQRKKVRLDDLLAGLRQESSEHSLKTSLDKSVSYLQEVKLSCSQCVSDQCQLLECLLSVSLEEVLSYSSSLSAFYRLHHTYRPSPEQLQNLHLSSTRHTDPETSGGAETQNPEQLTEHHPISCQNNTDPAQLPHDWLTEAEASLLDLYDISSDVIFTSSSGVAYSGPAFRCPAPNLLDNQTHLSLFPVDVLTVTLSRWRSQVMDHLEQRVHDVLSAAIVTTTERTQAGGLDLQLQQLNPQHIETHVYQPRLAELQLHRQCVDVHCQQLCDVLTSCRVELQELQTSISRRNQDFTVTLSNMEEDVLTADSSLRLEAVSSALHLHLDQHIKHTQRCETAFRQTVQMRLDEVRDRTTQLLNSFRLFSEGGDFAPQEVKMFQRRLKEETKQISVTQETIFTQLEKLQSNSLQQVKEASDRFEEKLGSLRSEVKFSEKIQRVISNTQVLIKAEASCSNQQQFSISSRLEDLRRMMENPQVSPGQVCCVLSLVHEDLMKRCQYLDVSLDLVLQERLPAQPKSRKVRSAPLPVSLQQSRTGVDLLDELVVGVIKSLNSRFSTTQEVASEADERRKSAAGQNPDQRLQGGTESVTALSVRRGRSIRTDRRFQVFGAEPEQTTSCFSSSVNSVLWRANDVLLLVAEDLYCSERYAVSRFLLLPDSLDQWAESMQLRLLGYQEQARVFLSMSRDELATQLSVLEELLHSLPAVLISNHERQREAELREELGGVRLKLEETLAASEKEKCETVRQLRASLRQDELQTLSSREDQRQQQLHSTVCCSHLELQECLRVRGEEFVTSLASLTENLLCQLDTLLTPTETKAALSQPQSEDSTVTLETATEPEKKPCTVSRTWSGISYFTVPNNPTTDPLSIVTMTTTASITTTRCTLGHLAVIEQRDAAVQRFEQLIRSESSHSDDDKQRRLRELQSWSTHWRQQIHTHTLTHTHTHTDTHMIHNTHTHTH